jgi:TonB-dependent starch-binding outer membrane protein SusC
MRFQHSFYYHTRWKILCGWFFLLLLFWASSAGAQQLSLSVKEAPIESVFGQVKKQVGFTFLYTSEELKNAKPVTVSFQNWPLSKALDAIFAGQPLGYTIDQTYVIVKPLPVTKERHEIRGRVTDESGAAIPNVSVTVRGTLEGATTGTDGSFTLRSAQWPVVLQVTAVGYQPQVLTVKDNHFLDVTLQTAVSRLDEQVVIAYGSTTRRLNTGSVSKVKAAEIENQPVSNPLAALQGRAAGVYITQSNGLPGSNFTVQIRGRNSIQQGTEPLYVIDGVIFPAERLVQRSVLNANSPFNTINPLDIESIEILKDADATAIYGSRGSNGVVIITTKRPKKDRTELAVNVYSGVGMVTRATPLLNTPQYLAMRREAFANDGVTPTGAAAPDLLLWDSTKYTDWTKKITGRKAAVTDANLRFTTGSQYSQLALGANMHKEKTVFPGDFSDQRLAFHVNAYHQDPGRKWQVEWNASVAKENSLLPAQDPTSLIFLPPNFPDLYDSAGNLRWFEKGESFNNPLGQMLQHSKAGQTNWSMGLKAEYNLLRNLKLAVSGGMNALQLSEQNTVPIASQNPAYNPKGNASFGRSEVNTVLIEPQLRYEIGTPAKWKAENMVGFSYQQATGEKWLQTGFGYTNDALIHNIAGAASVTATNESSVYKYHAVFARTRLSYSQKYLLSLSGRIDASSRFGPGKQFARFGAVGAGWIFTKEKWFGAQSLLTFGKLKGSYGTTGNDQIANYNFLESWTSTTYPYGGAASLRPTKLFNPDYRWEQSTKSELGLEVGLWKERLVLSVNWFQTRSGNQIVSYSLPGQAGFTIVQRNFPGLVTNTGFELEATAQTIQAKNVTWITTLNFTRSRNRLEEFPGLASSSYSSRYRIGQPLNLLLGYEGLGVDPATGLYVFRDVNNDGKLSSADYTVGGTTDPAFYGGINNQFAFRNWTFSIHLQFVKAKNYHQIYRNINVPGNMNNVPVDLLNHWRKPGDRAPYQLVSAAFGSPAFSAAGYLLNSSTALTDASFIRGKNLSLSYDLPTAGKRFRARLFLEAQNLFVITGYQGADPEVGNYQSLPPLKVITAGFTFNF